MLFFLVWISGERTFCPPPSPPPHLVVSVRRDPVGEMGMATAPVVCLATWALFGIQEIGLLIEDPFQVTTVYSMYTARYSTITEGTIRYGMLRYGTVQCCFSLRYRRVHMVGFDVGALPRSTFFVECFAMLS